MFQDTKSFKLDIWNGVFFQNWNFPITDDIFVFLYYGAPYLSF